MLVKLSRDGCKKNADFSFAYINLFSTLRPDIEDL